MCKIRFIVKIIIFNDNLRAIAVSVFLVNFSCELNDFTFTDLMLLLY